MFTDCIVKMFIGAYMNLRAYYSYANNTQQRTNDSFIQAPRGELNELNSLHFPAQFHASLASLPLDK